MSKSYTYLLSNIEEYNNKAYEFLITVKIEVSNEEEKIVRAVNKMFVGLMNELTDVDAEKKVANLTFANDHAVQTPFMPVIRCSIL